jgi:hypothetical protein
MPARAWFGTVGDESISVRTSASFYDAMRLMPDPDLHALRATCDQGEPHDSSADGADQRASTQGIYREDVVKAAGPCPPADMRVWSLMNAPDFPHRSGIP